MSLQDAKIEQSVFNAPAQGRGVISVFGVRPPSVFDEDLARDIQTLENESAFSANPISAAAQRMRYYLMSIRSGNVAVAEACRKKDEKRKKDFMARTFEIITTSDWYLKTSLLAATALGHTVGMYTNYRSAINVMIEKAENELGKLSGQIDSRQEDVVAVKDRLSTLEKAAVQMDEKVTESAAVASEAEKTVFETNESAVDIENRAIKIVRPLRSIGELRKSLTEPEMEAPEIYVAASEDEDGKIVYDRISMDEDGVIRIEKVHEHGAPDLLKDGHGLVTDMFERVYHHQNKNGSIDLLRMEYGMNGSLMGKIGDISSDMLAQYLAATGKDITKLTAGAEDYEEKIEARNANIDNYNAACETHQSHRHTLSEIKAVLENAVVELSDYRSDLVKLQEMSSQHNERLARLRDELTRVDRIISWGRLYKQKVLNGEFSSLENMLEDMPEALKSEFLETFNAMHDAQGMGACGIDHQHQASDDIGSAWSKVTKNVSALQDNKAPAPVFQRFTNVAAIGVLTLQ